MTLALPFVGCSSSSEPEPPQLGDCVPTATVKCNAALVGGSPGAGGGPGVGASSDSGVGTGDGNVNPPGFDGNLGLPTG